MYFIANPYGLMIISKEIQQRERKAMRFRCFFIIVKEQFSEKNWKKRNFYPLFLYNFIFFLPDLHNILQGIGRIS